MKWLEQEMKVCLSAGVHGRVATRLAAIAGEYNVRISLVTDRGRAEANCILDILALALARAAGSW